MKNLANNWLIIIVLTLLTIFSVACTTKQHIDKGYIINSTFHNTVDDLEHIGGYTVVEKHISDREFWFFLIKTDTYRLMKENGKGLLSHGEKGRVVRVTQKIYESVTQDDSIPAVVEKDK